MDCKEIRVDMRKMTTEEMENAKRISHLVFKLNHTEPMTEEYSAVLKEL